MKIKLRDKEYKVDVLVRKKCGSEGVSILLPTHNGKELTRVAVECIKKFTSVEYELWVIDNASDDGTVEWLSKQDDINVILNKTGTHQKGESWWTQYGGSYANAIGLEMGQKFVNGRWTFTMHNDALPCADKWMERLISKTSETIKGVGTRRDPGRVKAMHQSGMLFETKLFHDLEMNYYPNMPDYDVGDHVTLALEKNRLKCYFFKNTFNQNGEITEWNPRTIWLDTMFCDKVIDDEGLPFYLHLGRGTLQATGAMNLVRKTTWDQWVRSIDINLLGRSEKRE